MGNVRFGVGSGRNYPLRNGSYVPGADAHKLKNLLPLSAQMRHSTR